MSRDVDQNGPQVTSTKFNEFAGQLGYSLFARLLDGGNPRFEFTTQYRTQTGSRLNVAHVNAVVRFFEDVLLYKLNDVVILSLWNDQVSEYKKTIGNLAATYGMEFYQMPEVYTCSSFQSHERQFVILQRFPALKKRADLDRFKTRSSPPSWLLGQRAGYLSLAARTFLMNHATLTSPRGRSRVSRSNTFLTPYGSCLR
jgi:hypothetical protein